MLQKRNCATADHLEIQGESRRRSAWNSFSHYPLDFLNTKLLSIAFLISQVAGLQPAMATPASILPTRDPNTPGYVEARELPDGTIPPADADGNFIIGPTHQPAPEMLMNTNVPQGTIYEFTMSSADS